MRGRNKIFILAVFFFLLGVFFSKQTSAQGLVSTLDNYCVDSSGSALGYYVADGGKSCGRAPFCAGKSYDEANSINYEAVDDCWNHRCDWGMCIGQVPLCCYEIERTGDPTYCNWPERGYCHPVQCAKVDRTKQYECGASIGDDCNCGDPLIGWCVTNDHCVASAGDIPYVPLDARVGSSVTSTPTLSPTPTGFVHPCTTLAKTGDYDCSGQVSSSDYTAWKADFLAGKISLSYFEYYRRVAVVQ